MIEKEFKRRQIEFYAAATVGATEVIRGLGSFLTPMPTYLAYNAGDFAAGYLINWSALYTMETFPGLKRISEKSRVNIGSGVALGLIAAVELSPIFGTPDLLDIPAGVLGILASYGVRRLAQRWVGEKIN